MTEEALTKMKSGRRRRGRKGSNNINAVNNSTTSVICLFCATSWTSTTDTEESSQKSYQHQHQQMFLKDAPHGDDDDVNLQGHLRAIFILRQVLRLSPEQCADYLSRNNGSLNPDGWFSLCSSCGAAVRECFTLRRSIAQLERQLEVAKLRLLNLIYSTGRAERKRVKRRRRHEAHHNFTFDIRDTVLKKDLSVLTHDDTLGGGTATKTKKVKRQRSGGGEEGIMNIKSSLRKDGATKEIGNPARRRKGERRAKKLSRMNTKSTKSAGKPGSDRRNKGPKKRREISQNDSKTATSSTTTITIRLCKKIPPPEEEHADQSMELEPSEESTTLHNNNPIIPESREHNVDDEDDDDVASLCEVNSARSSENINGDDDDDDSGSNWSPSEEVEPNSEAEEDDHQRQYSANESPSDGPTTQEEEEKEDAKICSSSNPVVVAFPSPQSANRLVGSLLSNYRYRCDLCPASYEKESRLAVHSKLHEVGSRSGSGQGVVNCAGCGWLVPKQRLKQHVLQFCRSNNNKVPPWWKQTGKRGTRAEEEKDSSSDWSPPSDRGEPDSDHEEDERPNNAATKTTKLRHPETKMNLLGESPRDEARLPEGKEMSLGRPATCSTSQQSQPANNIGDDVRSRHGVKVNSRPHRCHHCPAAYKHQAHLATHSKLHGKRRRVDVVNCDKCGWLVLKPRLKQHALHYCSYRVPRLTGNKRDPDGIPYYCDHCHMIFPSEFRLLRHCSTHHSGGALSSCQYCASEFVSGQLLQLHIDAVHSSSEYQQFQDDDDGASAPPSSPPPPPPSSEEDCKLSPCPYCPSETFPSKMKLDFHVALRHRDALLTCQTCKLKCVNYSAYVAHLQAHKRREVQRAKREEEDAKKIKIPFYCDHCHMIFTQEKFIVKHVRGFHSSAQPASCPHCDSNNFVSRQLLALHVEAVHPEEVEKSPDGGTGPLPPPPPEDSNPKSCPYCPEVGFPSKLKLDFHIAKVHREALLTCPTCQFKAASFHTFVLHSRSHQRRTVRYGKPKKPRPEEEDAKPGSRIIFYSYQCPHCPATYSSRALVSTHAKLHENGGDVGLYCDKCGWLVAKQQLGLHQSQSCTSKRRRRRQRKIANLTDKSTFSYELRTLTEGIPYYCDHCHMIYTQTTALVKHVQLHHAGAGMRVCQTCGSSFVSQQLLQMHLDANHHHAEEMEGKMPPPPPPPPPEDSEPRNCPHCSSIFPSKMKLDYHVASVHRESLLTCPKPNCQFKTDCYSGFVAHSRTHQERKELEKTFSCHLCGLQLGTQNSINCHMQLVHAAELGLEEITCPICGVNMSSQSALRNHIKYVHEKRKEHFCEFCGKAFCTSSDLRKHLLLHTAPRELQYKKGPFPCQYCDSKFNVRQGLYYHLKRAHSDKYRFRCEECGKGYCSKTSLTHHHNRGECKGKGGTTAPTPPTSS